MLSSSNCTSCADLLLQYLFGKGAPSKMITVEKSREATNDKTFAERRRNLIWSDVVKTRSPSSVKLLALLFSLSIHYFVSGTDNHCDPDCLYPRRPETEELFNNLGHHEASATLAVTMAKLDVRLL